MQADSIGVNGNPSAPSVTTTGGSRLVLAFYANKKPTTYSGYTSPAVERFDVPNVPGGLPSNALASYTQAAAGATGAKSATPGEAAEWVAQQIAIAPAAGASATKFSWDVNHPLPELALERDAAGSLLRRYLYGNDRYSLQTPAGSFYYHPDGLGSISNVTDAAGAKQWSYSWEPFGTPRTQTQDAGSAPANPMRFTGEYEDQTGLYHLRARQFDPTAGRFLSYDPLEQSLGDPAVSPYAYVSNRPTVFVDPSGLECEYSPFGVLHCAKDAAVGTVEAGVHVAGKTWEAATGLDDALVALATCPTEEWFAIGCIRLIGGAAIDAASGLWDELTACVGSFGTTDMRTGTRRCMKLILGFAAGGVVVKLLKRLATHGKDRDDEAQDSGRELGEDPATGAFRQSEFETARRIQAERGVTLTRSEDPAVDWRDESGNTYDAVGNFDARFFASEWPNLQQVILGHLQKADFVAVDVSRFTPAQIAEVSRFAANHPRVFLVGR